MKRAWRLIAWVILGALLAPAAPAPVRAQEQSQEEQGQPQKEQKKKKKGGFFGGLKAVSGSSSEQQEATRTAGSKTVGEGESIGDLTPSAADRQAVSAMEGYSIPAPELKKFQDRGKLKARQ